MKRRSIWIPAALLAISFVFLLRQDARSQAPERTGYVTDPGNVLPNDLRENLEEASRSDGRIYIYIHKGRLQDLRAASDMIWEKWGLKSDNVLLVVCFDGKDIHFRFRPGGEAESEIAGEELGKITSEMERLLSAGQVRQAFLFAIDGVHSELNRARNRTIGLITAVPLIGIVVVLIFFLAKRRSLKEKKKMHDALGARINDLLTRMEKLTGEVEKQRLVARGFPPDIKSKYYRQLNCLSPGSVKEVLDRIDGLNFEHTADLATVDRKVGEIESAIVRIAEAVELVDRLSLGGEMGDEPAGGSPAAASSRGVVGRQETRDRSYYDRDDALNIAGGYAATEYVERRAADGSPHHERAPEEGRAVIGGDRDPGEGHAQVGSLRDSGEGHAQLGSLKDPGEGRATTDEPFIADPFGGAGGSLEMADFPESGGSAEGSDIADGPDSSGTSY